MIYVELPVFEEGTAWWSLLTRPQWSVLRVGILNMADAYRFARTSGSDLTDPLFSVDINVLASAMAA